MSTCPFCTAVRPNDVSPCPQCQRSIGQTATASRGDDDGQIAFHEIAEADPNTTTDSTLSAITARTSDDAKSTPPTE